MIFIIVISILCLDQLSKALIAKNLLLNQSLPVINGFFHLSLVHNRGGAFGILKNQVPFLLFTSVFAVALIISNLRKSKGRKPLLVDVALGLILSGALGNLIDRAFLGYVVDFLDFRVWPVFNLADSAITIGAVLLGWQILGRKK